MVRDMVDSAEKIVLFYNNSPKRNKNFQEWVQCVCPESRRMKLLDTCQTRFIERHDAWELFCELYPAIEQSLCEMANDKSFNRDISLMSSPKVFVRSLQNFSSLLLYRQ